MKNSDLDFAIEKFLKSKGFKPEFAEIFVVRMLFDKYFAENSLSKEEIISSLIKSEQCKSKITAGKILAKLNRFEIIIGFNNSGVSGYILNSKSFYEILNFLGADALKHFEREIMNFVDDSDKILSKFFSGTSQRIGEILVNLGEHLKSSK